MESVQSALNITDNSVHVGFWFTVKDVEGSHSQIMSALRGRYGVVQNVTILLIGYVRGRAKKIGQFCRRHLRRVRPKHRKSK